MKKLILSAAILGSAIAVHAQAGSVLVYGNIGIHSEKDPADNKVFNFNINPGVGYQFDNHWTVGLTGGFGTMRDKSNDTGAKWTYENDYSIAPFVRYTQPLGRIFAVYGQLEAGYKGSTVGVEDAPSDANIHANGFYAQLTPAIGVNVWKGFGLNFGFGGLGVESMKVKDAKKANTVVDFNFGQQFNIGISKNFGGTHYHKHHHGDGGTTIHGSKWDNNDEGDDDDNSKKHKDEDE